MWQLPLVVKKRVAITQIKGRNNRLVIATLLVLIVNSLPVAVESVPRWIMDDSEFIGRNSDRHLQGF